ncbi:MAG: nucleotidyltransferase domain-containing protein [Actinomycetia bacterium]|nr:nucleotidyltransferase domain-containing protein [Actinomycetes bacterium]
MDLASPLAIVTPTLDAGVLQVLIGTTQPCTAAEVHRRLGRGSDEGVRKVLTRLTAQGIVLTASPSRYPVYWLNRDHVGATHLEGLARARSEVLERIRTAVDGWSQAPHHVSVFGSFARGDGDLDSDIDLLLVSPATASSGSEDEWADNVASLCDAIERWTGNRAQALDIDIDTLRSMAARRDPLIESIRREGVHVFGARFGTLLDSSDDAVQQAQL